MKNSLYRRVVTWFDEDGWHLRRDDERCELRSTVRGTHFEFGWLVRVLEAHRVVAFYTTMQPLAPEKSRAALSEFVTRANVGMMVGNFEMDLECGGVMFKTSVALGDGTLTDEMMRTNVMWNVKTMDRYHGGLRDVMAGRMSAAEAIAQIEG